MSEEAQRYKYIRRTRLGKEYWDTKLKKTVVGEYDYSIVEDKRSDEPKEEVLVEDKEEHLTMAKLMKMRNEDLMKLAIDKEIEITEGQPTKANIAKLIFDNIKSS